MLSFATRDGVGRRREFLTLGSLAALGVWGGRAGTPATESAENATPPGFGRAKRCLLLFLTGGPSQLDTWDPKPEAPAEIRGEFAPISTATPGLLVSELFPLLAQRSEKYRVVRSLTHHDTVHATAGYALLTGDTHRLANKAVNGSAPPGPEDRPHLASACLHHRQSCERQGACPLLPPFSMPEIIKDAGVNEVPGQDAGFLGKRFAPILVEADTQGTRLLPPPVTLHVDVPLSRLKERVALRRLIDAPRETAHSERRREAESLFERGISLLESPRLRTAFDLEAEPTAARDAYGRHLFGQCTLLARRLLEAGSSFVTVYWHYEGPDDSPVWDTHWNNFRHLRERLAAPADRAVSAMLDDLEVRGLLDETLVLCLGEFGRSPRINHKVGRDHWPFVFNAIVAGAGIPGGTVCGASDAHGAYPAHLPITPQEFGATVLHQLGVPASHEFTDQVGRPHRAGLGPIRPELFG